MNEQINTTNESAEEIEQLELPGMPEPIVVQVELDLDDVIDQVIEATKRTEFNMYQLSKALNAVLSIFDIQVYDSKKGEMVAYQVRSQAMYNYNRNKMIGKNEQGKGIFLEDHIATAAQTREFIKRFVAKRLSN